jgi:hypothetical protein
VHATLETTQLLDFSLPSQFSTARDQFLSAQQDVSRARNDLVVAEASARSRVGRAEEEAGRFITRAEGYATSRLIDASGARASLTERIGAFASGLSTIQVSLNSSTNDLLSFAWIEAVQAARDRGLTVTLNAPYPEGLTPVAA